MAKQLVVMKTNVLFLYHDFIFEELFNALKQNGVLYLFVVTFDSSDRLRKGLECNYFHCLIRVQQKWKETAFLAIKIFSTFVCKPSYLNIIKWHKLKNITSKSLECFNVYAD